MATDEATQKFPLDDYFLFYQGGFDKGRVSQLHDLVISYHDRFLDDEALQNVFLNSGHEMEDERPTSYHHVLSSVWHRSLVSANLFTLETVIDLYTRPFLTVLEKQTGFTDYNVGDIIFGNWDETYSLTTPEGYDISAVENLQKEWFSHPEVTTILRDYRNALTKSFDQFNLQFILSKMDKSRIYFADWEPEKSIISEINDTFGSPDEAGVLYTVLDNAYYNAGKQSLGHRCSLYDQLRESEFGSRFLPSSEELRSFLAK